MAIMVMDDRPATAEMIRDAAALPRLDRTVLLLRWCDRLTRAEAAAVLECPTASVLAAELRLLTWAAARAAGSLNRT